MRIIRDTDGRAVKRAYDEFEVFKARLGLGYVLSTLRDGEWEELFEHSSRRGLRATADILNTKWGDREEAAMKELDLTKLEGDLRKVTTALGKRNYGIAETYAWIAFADVAGFRMQLDEEAQPGLPATTDRNPRALLTKALYWLLNRKPLRCRRLGYHCEWVYPYGWVPEGGCPDHD